MLVELRIVGLGVIGDAVLEPGPGLTVVTGETGAGKTLVVSGLSLVAGARAEARVVRQGADRAVVEARFVDVPEAVAASVDEAGGVLDDRELLVVRQVAANGRSRSLLGGAQVPAAVGADIGARLVTIHGQAEQQRLAAPERQREVLDRSAGPELAAELAAYRADYSARQLARTELARLKEQARERAREQDLLAFGLQEIAAVAPEADEDVALAAEAGRLQAVDDLRLFAHHASVALSGDEDSRGDEPNALSLVAEARKALESASDADAQATELASQAREVTALVGDLAATTASYLADLDADPIRLEWVASRRSQLQGLTRKYGETVAEVLDWATASASRLTELQASDNRIEALTSEVATLTKRVTVSAERITTMRVAAASKLSAAVRQELAALALPHARLEFAVTALPEPGPYGADAVSLLFSANPGAQPGPLAKVASGGELSRVRLALEVVLADAGGGETFVFDEVDAGIGGAVALEVGSRLARLARLTQVIVVTHLAQVAAYGDRHFVVLKSDDGTVTTSGLRAVDGDERLRELARMMGGHDDTEASRAHADDLLARATKDRAAR
ncbi:MAG TPA: DNA repair protein RecN [Propionibacteriaceae bacterium]